jgi:hypothetical protein
VATVLPYCPFVTMGKIGRTGFTRPPLSPLMLPADARCHAKPPASIERHVAAFAMTAFGGLPLELLAWTRLPYLCSGDTDATHYYLDNVLYVLRRTPDVPFEASLGRHAPPQQTAAARHQHDSKQPAAARLHVRTAERA